ncbi:MAG TPA: hypothetical protein DEQ32_05750 [Gammaproteobacteria bacterium]|nr:hypothetical protein [Gammaproteobacteria bacterium]|tara:strand:- start:1785 stop:1994 length:210 start_codon:yes stop_codon:yes gene_type:complete
MKPGLEQRIAEKENWTFSDCVGLATEFGLKTRAVIAFIMLQGKNYIDGPEDNAKPDSSNQKLTDKKTLN